MALGDWNTPNFSWGENWGNIPQLNGTPGYGMPSLDVPAANGGITSFGGPAYSAAEISGGVGTANTPFWESDFWKGAFGSTDAQGVKTNGWAGSALGLLQGGLGAFMGMKQYGLAKDALAQSKKQFNLNYAAQKQTTNAALEDRQRARNASNPGAYQGTDEYMAQYGIK